MARDAALYPAVFGFEAHLHHVVLMQLHELLFGYGKMTGDVAVGAVHEAPPRHIAARHVAVAGEFHGDSSAQSQQKSAALGYRDVAFVERHRQAIHCAVALHLTMQGTAGGMEPLIVECCALLSQCSQDRGQQQRKRYDSLAQKHSEQHQPKSSFV